MVQQFGTVEQPNHQHHHQIDRQQFGIARRKCHAVDDAQAHHHEEVSHLTDFYGLRSVTYHPENGKQAEGVCDVHLHVLHQRNDEENDHGKHDEGEIIVLAVGLFVVEAMDDKPTDEKIEHEADQGRPKALCIEERYAEEVEASGTTSKLACNVGIEVL